MAWTRAVRQARPPGRPLPGDGAPPLQRRLRDRPRICGGTDALDICTWGRRRWNIESDFNVEKHGGFGLEHTFCTSDRQAANMHLLMLLAHLLWQVVFRGVLRRIYAGCRKLAQEKLVKLIQRVLHMRGPPSTGRQFQLRFSTG